MPRAAGGAEQAPLHLGALRFTGIKPGLKKQGEQRHMRTPLLAYQRSQCFYSIVWVSQKLLTSKEDQIIQSFRSSAAQTELAVAWRNTTLTDYFR